MALNHMNNLKNRCLLALGGAMLAACAVSHAEERYVILDDDVGFHNAGCAQKGYLNLFKVANPALKPQWGALDLVRLCDHDGGVELIYTLYKAQMDPHLHVLGVTTMQGTEYPEYTYQSALNIINRLKGQLKEPVPVFMGAPKAAASFGERTPAVDFIIKTVMANPGKVEIIASGPLTNVATAVMLEPRLPRMWKQLYVAGMGNFLNELVPGYHYLGDLQGVPEMNANGDVRAAQYLVEHQDNTTWFSGEATEVHPWGICMKDWQTISNAGFLKFNFQSYLAAELWPWQMLVAIAGPFTSWKDGCGNDSGATQIALWLYPELRGKHVESAVDVIVHPTRKDGSYAETLSQNPDKPKVPIYYSVQGDWQKVKDEVMQALLYFH